MTPVEADQEPARTSLNYREEPMYLTEDTDLYCLDDSLFPIIEEEAEE